jgi:hypothetical protein
MVRPKIEKVTCHHDASRFTICFASLLVFMVNKYACWLPIATTYPSYLSSVFFGIPKAKSLDPTSLSNNPDLV